MEFRLLAETLDQVQKSSKRLEKSLAIVRLLRSTPADLHEKIILMLQGRVFPEFDQVNMGISIKLTLKALSQATGTPAAHVLDLFHKHGDVGTVAEIVTQTKTQRTLFSQQLDLEEMFIALQKLAKLSGRQSTGEKVSYIAGILGNATPAEAKVVCGIIVDQLRAGIATGSIRDAVVWATFPSLAAQAYDGLDFADLSVEQTTPVKSVEDIMLLEQDQYDALVAEQEPLALLQTIIAAVQRAIDLTSSLAYTAQVLAKEGFGEVKNMNISIFRPFHVMLAQKAATIDDALVALGTPVFAEYKYDGFRMQIHKRGGTVRLFTRRLEEVTDQFPDVVERILIHVAEDVVILDAEIVGIDKNTGKYLAFQAVSRRIRRKHKIDELAAEFPVDVRVFDLIMQGDVQMIDEPLYRRRELLQKLMQENDNIGLSTLKEISTADEVVALFDEAMAMGNEGLMLKKRDAPYQPGSRVGTMLKYKKTMETLDLVITKAARGEGKRSKWLTSYTVACKDESGELLEIGKVSTGLKELDDSGMSFAYMTELLESLMIKDHGKEIEVKPEVIVEVAFEEIQKSPSYSSGLALRFPRFLLLREDRGVDDVSDINYIDLLYKQQRGRG